MLFSWGRAKLSRFAGIMAVAWALVIMPVVGLDTPTGAPLALSSIETEQAVPLAILSPDGKTASCVPVRLHWDPQQNPGADQDATSFTLDIAPDSPGASIFTAQLWNASLASALAWQQPWEGARWKILDTPATDGTGIDAALAVGMIATSARRPYPKDTAVIGSLKPDGTLGAVSQLAARLDALAASGITRVIIPSVQRFDVDANGQVLNIMRHADDLHLKCIPVDNLVQATEAVMNDPLPPVTLSGTTPKYGDDVASYIDGFAHREQTEMASGLAYAPKEDALGTYPPRVAAVWKTIYSDNEAAQQAYRAGQVYMAYRLFAHANGLMHGVNALSGQNRITFDVKQALADSDDLRSRVHQLTDLPSIDQGDLESAVLVSEMADWAYDISAALEGAQLVTKQTFSVRSDATDGEKDRAREAILFANAEATYLLDGADFYTGLLSHVTANPIPVDTNAAHLLPQLIPAQLATAEIFTEGIRSRANDLRDGLLFDPRLVAYINVLRETKSAWETRQHKKQIDSTTPAAATPDALPAATKLNAATTDTVGFDPGNTYQPSRTQLVASANAKKLSDVASCLIWVNNDCEIAVLDEKYLHLGGTIDPVTHAWKIKDRAKLDQLLQSAEGGARLGITFAEKAEVDSSVLDMIYERAAQLRLENDDSAGLDSLRNYWRCALLGNMCWQLAHTRKAEPVNLAGKDSDKPKGKDDKSKADDKTAANDKGKDVGNKHSPADKSGAGVAADPAKSSAAGLTPPTATHSNTDQLAIGPPPESAPDPPVTDPTAVDPPAAIVPTAIPPATNAAPDTSHAPRALPVTDDNSVGAAPASGAVPISRVALPATIPPVAVPAATPVLPSPTPSPAPTPAPAAQGASGAVTTGDDANIPVAPVARSQDLAGAGGNTDSSTNAPAAIGPPPPSASDKAATGD